MDATALVCLHGLGRSPSDWDGVRGRLGELGPVIAPALPRDVRRAQQIAAAATPDGSILVGHSMGAIIALLLAAESGSAVRGVVASSAFFPPSLNGRSLPVAVSRYAGHRIAFLRELRRKDRPAGPGSGGVRGLGFLVRTAAHRAEFRAKMMSITAEVLVVHARDDHYVPLEFVSGAGAASPGWQLTVLNGGGHYPHVREPTEWLAAVVPWLTRLRSSPRQTGEHG